MALRYIDEATLTKKRVLARFDFNVPLDKNDSTKILDTSRIDEALPTIKYILENGASKLIMMSHLGRPKGEKNLKYSLEPVAKYLAEKLNHDVLLTESALDNGIISLLKLSETKIVLLENLRFHPEEEKDDPFFAQKLSEYADLYVNDAFGAIHRKHASVHEINKYFKRNAFGGFLLKKEIEALSNITESPKRPFMAIVGGAKVKDKIKILEKLIIDVDGLFIGGAMAYPFLKAKGFDIGKSLCDEEDVLLAQKILKLDRSNKITLPLDHIVTNSLKGTPIQTKDENINSPLIGFDIGERTLMQFKEKLQGAKTILWNGPMGLFEEEKFSNGTMKLADIITQTKAYTFVGGGDSVSAVKKSKLENKFSHVSTGGGASLEYIENGTLPGISALKFGLN